MSFTLTDTDAKNIYSALYRYYGGQQLPDNDTGVFFDTPNFTRDKLYYCIEALKRYWGKGWYTEDATKRTQELKNIASILYVSFDSTVDVNKIYKFLVWCYSWARKDADAVAYFQGGDYSMFDDLKKNIGGKISSTASNVAETVSYGVNYPTVSSLTPKTSTIVKWGVIIGLGLIAVKFVEKRLARLF